jgi:uncharacterized protein (TIGR03067 family)
MRPFFLLAVSSLLTVGLFGAAPADKDVEKQELKKLEGTWKIVKVEGKEANPNKKKHLATIKGSTIDFGDTTEPLEFIIDPSQDPKWFDIKLPLTNKVTETVLGIYELEGDKLKLCLVGGSSTKTGPARPKEFKVRKGDGGETFVVYLEREKQ